MERLKVAVMGAGAVGGYFGGRLALAGHEVHFVARGEHLRALQAEGLRVRSARGDFHVRVHATGDPREVGPVDLLLFTVKTYDLEAAAEAARPMVGPQTLVLPLQNGVDAPDYLAEVYGVDRVLGGSCKIEVTVAAPGVIEHPSPLASIAFGELSGGLSPRVERLREVFQAAGGAEVEASPDIRRVLWEKLIFLATLSAFTTATGLPIGPVREHPPTRELLARMLGEVTAVARAEGIALPDDHPDRVLAFILGLPGTMKSSMQRDRERGRRLEVEAIQGAVVRRARRHGIPVPVTETLYAILSLWRDGSPQVPAR